MTASFASLLDGSTSTDLFSWRGDPDRDLVGEAESAGWRALHLDTTDVHSVEGFYDEVTTAWGLPSWFGRNLDALFDVLGDLTVTPLVLVWDGLRELSAIDPMQAAAVLDVLRDAVGQAASFAVIVRDDLGVSEFDGLL
jgi:RNAse (barnase) inhibitor barstar